MRAILNSLGPITHILAGLIPLSFAAAADAVEPSLPLVLMVMAFSLLPDIDSSQSLMGRIFGPVSEAVESRFGHRTLTHTAAFAAAMGLFCWAWFPASDWWVVWAAWLSHLIIDMIIGLYGVPLLWPLTDIHFYLVTVKPRSNGELFAAAACGLLIAAPWYEPAAADMAASFMRSQPLPTATPELLQIRIAHVFDPSSEILVSPGDRIERGQLIADLATWRMQQLQPTPPPTAAQPVSIQLDENTTVSGHPDDLAAILTPTPDFSALQARLREAELALAMARAKYDSVMRSDVEISEKELAALELEKAEADFEQARLKATPTPTRTPKPTATPRPTEQPQGDLIHAVVSGVVADVKIESVAGNEAVVAIYVDVDGGGQHARVLRVVDGDTVNVNTETGKETVRLIGVDTPETKHPEKGIECYGPEASEQLAAMLPSGMAVRLEADAEARDRYGRLLAYVWMGERMVNRELLQHGYARPMAIEPNTSRAAEFEALAAAARAGGVGLWGACE